MRFAPPWAWSLANFEAVFGNLTGEVARPTLWRGRPRPRYPGLRFAPPWASDVYHAFGVLLRSELLKLPYCRVLFYAKHTRSAGLFSERLLSFI